MSQRGARRRALGFGPSREGRATNDHKLFLRLIKSMHPGCMAFFPDATRAVSTVRSSRLVARFHLPETSTTSGASHKATITHMRAFIPTTVPRTLFAATHLTLPTRPIRPSLRQPADPRQSRSRRIAIMAVAEAPPLDGGMVLFAKAGPDGACMGDCPFTMKANLALRFKRTDFKTHFIDLSDKPAWFLDLNEDGTTPVFVDGTHAIGDSDEIVEYADKVGTASDVVLMREDEPRWDAAFDAVSPIFGALVRLLKNKEPAEEEGFVRALGDALRRLNAFLAEGTGPFLLGDKVSALDCNLAPKLQHVVVAAAHYKGFEVPRECEKVIAYMDNMRNTEEWKACSCPDDVIVWGWGKFFS